MTSAVRNAVAAGVVLAGAGAWWWWLAPGDEAEIRGVLDRISTAVSASGNRLERASRAASIRDELDPDIEVNAGAPFRQLRGRDAVIATAARLHASLGDLDVRFRDVEITIEPDAGRARVRLTAEARFGAGRVGREFDARELDFVFLRREGRWRVTHVALVRALRPLRSP
jgi:hypothetical protein